MLTHLKEKAQTAAALRLPESRAAAEAGLFACRSKATIPFKLLRLSSDNHLALIKGDAGHFGYLP
jgi:hypothetical protein